MVWCAASLGLLCCELRVPLASLGYRLPTAVSAESAARLIAFTLQLAGRAERVPELGERVPVALQGIEHHLVEELARDSVPPSPLQLGVQVAHDPLNQLAVGEQSAPCSVVRRRH